MTKDEIISRIKNIAVHAIRTVGEEPFILSLDDRLALREAANILSMMEPSRPLLNWLGERQTVVVKMGDNVCTVYVDELLRAIEDVAEKGNESLLVNIGPEKWTNDARPV